MIVYIDGDYLPMDEALISPLDRGLLYGIGAFETLRAYDGNIFMLDAHVKRLRGGLEIMNIPHPGHLDSLQDIFARLIELNGLNDARLRVTVTAGDAAPILLCTAEALPPYGADLYKNGAVTITIDDPEKYGYSFSRIKSTSYLGNILIREEARKSGALEAIICHSVHGPIEGSMSNLFIVDDGVITTPPLSLPILPGITRDVVLKTAIELKLPINENSFTKERLLESNEVFITNSLMEIMPVTRIDEITIGNGKPGEITLKFLSAYRKNVQ